MGGVPAIRTEGLTKHYGDVVGLEDASFEVRRGEVFGFLGPNGAGKTTTIRTLLDLVRPTRGRAEVFGLDAREDSVEVHARTGYVPGDVAMAGRHTARDELAYLARLRGRGHDRIEALAERFKLDLDRPVRELSRGNRQKVALVQAFMHAPDLLLLDEPTAGLDPLMQQVFNQLVREEVERGASVFLSSHILPEVEHLCERIAIIRDGHVVAVEPVADVKARALRRVRVRFEGAARASVLEDVDGVSDVEVHGDQLTCRVRGHTGELVRALADTGVVDLVTEEPTLEDVFLGYYREGPA